MQSMTKAKKQLKLFPLHSTHIFKIFLCILIIEARYFKINKLLQKNKCYGMIKDNLKIYY